MVLTPTIVSPLAETARVYASDAQKPVGHLWVDGTLGFRFEVDLSLWVTPYIKAQYIKIIEENGVGNNTEFFMGAGLSAGFELAPEGFQP